MSRGPVRPAIAVDLLVAGREDESSCSTHGADVEPDGHLTTPGAVGDYPGERSAYFICGRGHAVSLHGRDLSESEGLAEPTDPAVKWP